PVLTICSDNSAFDGSSHAAQAFATGLAGEFLGPVSVTYNGSSTVPVNPGTYDIVATFAGDATYNPVSGSATMSTTGAGAPATISSSAAWARTTSPATPATTSSWAARLPMTTTRSPSWPSGPSGPRPPRTWTASTSSALAPAASPPSTTLPSSATAPATRSS